MKTMKTIYLTTHIVNLLDKKSKETGISKSALVEKALEKYLVV